MKTLQKITMLIAIVALFASCSPKTDVTKILANPETKQAIMDTIANDSNLSAEMMETMMNSKNSKMMLGNEKMTTMIMQNNPAMMQSMMTGMIETCNHDSAMMSSISSAVLRNPQMMEMIQKNMGVNMGTKDMNQMEGMNPKMK